MRKIKSTCLLIAMATSMLLQTNVMAEENNVSQTEVTTASTATATTATSTTATATTAKKKDITKKKKTKKKNKKKTDTSNSSSSKKSTETTSITAPTKAVTATSKITKEQEEIDQQIKKLKVQKKKLSKKFKGLDVKNEMYKAKIIQTFLDSIHNDNIPENVILTGVKNDKVSKISKESLKLKDAILDLANDINDDELINIANTYTFGTIGQNLYISDSNEEYSLTEHLYSRKKFFEDSENTIKREKKKITEEKKQITEQIKSLKKQRESLTKTKQFDPTNVLKVSNLTVNEFKQVLSGTALESLAQDFYDCEQTYGVNGIFIASIAGHESAWGTSRRAREDNNLTGYGVYSDSAKGINKKTKRENLIATTETLKERYLTVGGSYYKGTSVIDINKTYAADSNWANCVTNNGYKLIERLG